MSTSVATSETPLYDHGLPFTKELADNLDDQHVRVMQHGKASLILVDGGIGEGKTTLAVQCADYLNNKSGFPALDLSKDNDQYGMGGTDFLEKLRRCYEKKLPVCIYDEAGDFSKRQALSRFNAMINRTFETFRAFKIVVIMVLPSFAVVDNDIFDKGIPRMLIHCHDRDYSGHFKVFDHVAMMYIRHAMKKEVIKKKVYHYFTPNIRGHFLNLSEERSIQLDELSTGGKLDQLEQAQVKIQGLIGYKDIALRLAKSVTWARMCVNELKIKPVRLINRTKYFDESIIDILADYHLQHKKED